MNFEGYDFYHTKDDDGVDTDRVIKMLTSEGYITFIPKEPKNSHWKLYQAWLSDGNSTKSEQ